ncbi:MAG: cob(I)yrinic acid a,c-diamide adenosyltransferase [Nitrospinota bacterium]
MSITTRGGDKGDTSLLFGERVPKYHLQCESYGAVYEAMAALGLARSLVKNEGLKGEVLRIQQELVILNGELAAPKGRAGELEKKVTDDMLQRLDEAVRRYEEHIHLTDWTMAGASPGSAALDLATTIIRRAERWVVRMRDEGFIENPILLKYINRLSDVTFLMAREAEKN